MGRRRRDYLRRTEGKVVAWAMYHIQVIDEGGYPPATVEARLMEGGAAERMPPGPRVPARIMMPPDVADADRAIRVMPAALAAVIHRHYRKGEKQHRRRVTEALTWLAGRGL